MGEISDAIIDGACCEWCGVYFEEERGYPVLCNSCWGDASPEEREGHQQATNKEV